MTFPSFPRPVRIDTPELMDEELADPAQISGALDDLSRLNRLLGGSDLTRRAMQYATQSFGEMSTPLRVLDVATGAGDIPFTLLKDADARGEQIEVTALDRNDSMIEQARQRSGGRLELVQGDALEMPFDDQAFDVVTCSLMLHHFSPADAVRVLAEMRRVSSRVVIVNDLIRAWHSWATAKVLARVVTRNPLTRYDGPVSVLRSYTPGELHDLLRLADLRPRWRATFLGYRMCMLADRGE